MIPPAEIVGELVYGVEVNGVSHKTFRLGSLSVTDFLALESERVALVAQPDDAQREVALVRHGVKRLQARLVALGTLNLTSFDADGLAAKLKWPDMLTLSAACEELDAQLDSFRASRGWAPAHVDGAQSSDGLDAR